MKTILNRILTISGFTLSDLQSSCRKSEIVAARLLFAQEALKAGHHPKEIGKMINRHRTTIIETKNYKPSEHYIRLKLLYKRTQWGILRTNYQKWVECIGKIIKWLKNA